MQRSTPWGWILLAGILLLAPGPVGRLVVNLMGGLTIIALVAPLVLGGAGFMAWRLLQSRLRPCPACGFSSVGMDACPVCGSAMDSDSKQRRTVLVADQSSDQLQASTMTVDVDVTEVDQ